MKLATLRNSIAGKSAVALLLALVFLGGQEALGAKDGPSDSGKSQGSENKPEPNPNECNGSSPGCLERQERADRLHRHIETHRGRHHGTSQEFGRAGSASCEGGQGNCASGTGRGYRSLGSGYGASAADLYAQSRQVGELQRQIVTESMNEAPGSANPDARRLDESTRSGSSRRSDFTNATNPIVKEQIAQYNEFGDLRDKLDAEAKKYKDQEKEMNDLADKSEKNANNLASKNDGVNGNQPGAGGVGKPSSTIADGIESNAGEKTARNGQKVGSGKFGISANFFEESKIGVADKGSDIQTKYPTKISSTTLEKASGAVSGSTKGGSSLRDRLRDQLNSASSGGKSSRGKNASSLETTPEGPLSSAEKADLEARKASENGTSDDPISPFNKNLGNGTLAIAGSETDASVNAMLDEFGVSKDTRRQPASLQNSEIGAKDGPTLFERCHATHKRCEKSGCVILATKERAGG